MNSENTISPASVALSAAEIEFYQEQGYLILRNVFSASEIADLSADVDRVQAENAECIDIHNMRIRFRPHHQTGENTFEVIDPISDLSPVARALTRDRRILDVLHNLYGEPAELFKDKLIYKLPGASGATLHQDWIGWPGFPESFLSVVVAIDPFLQESGPTEVFPALHRNGYLSPKDGQHHYLAVENLAAEPVPLLLDPGDVAIFSCFTPHRSGSNTGTQARRGYFISYNARSDGGDQYQKHYREFHEWLRSKCPEPQRNHLYFR